MLSREPSDPAPSLTGADALTLLEIIQGCLSCTTDDDFRNLYPKIHTLFPFDFALTLLGYHDARHGFVEMGYTNISFPAEWLREYNARKYLQLDSIVRENFTTYEVQNWPVSRKALYRSKEITSLGLDFGLRECLTHGSSPSTTCRTGSMFCFAGPSMELDTRISAILDHLVPHLHLALSHVRERRRRDTGSIRLSAREREVLDWLKQGKSSWEISVILGISERTVNYHVYNIMGKLEARNRPQALAVAAGLGLISPG
jgi:DNA-binding CsgD family transcriptional regulator